MYLIEDGGDGILYVVVGGFLTADEADRFTSAIGAHLARYRAKGAPIRALVDASNSTVQSSVVLERLAEVKAQLVMAESDRAAIVVAPGLATLQAKRLMASNRSRICESLTEARAWLLS